MNNTSRKVVLVILAIIATVIVLKIMGAFKVEKEGGTVQQVNKMVRVGEITLDAHDAEVVFSGKLSADNKIELFAEVNGVLLNDGFKAGNRFKKGDVLLQLDASEFNNSLKAQKTALITQVSAIMGDLKIDFPNEASKWELFLNAIDVNKQIPALPKIEAPKLKRFVAGKSILNSYYTLKSAEDKLAKFKIIAPFNGIVTEAMVKKGTLVRAGQKMGVFIEPSIYELETEVSVSDLQFVKIGGSVSLKSNELNQTWSGKVVRINEALDVSSQMVKIYVQVLGKGLKEGMFLNGFAAGATFEGTAAVNRKLIKNNGLYTVINDVVKFKPVDVKYVNQSVAIVAGLKEGDLIITDNMKGLYDGLKVEPSFQK